MATVVTRQQTQDHLPAEVRERAQKAADQITDVANSAAGCTLIELLDPEYFWPDQLPESSQQRRHAMHLRFLADAPVQRFDCRGNSSEEVAKRLRDHAALYIRAAEAVEAL